jgi:hypothetical protein
VHERHRDVEPAGHAARVRAHEPVGRLVEPDLREQLVDARGQVAAAQAVDLALQAHVLAPGGVAVAARLLANAADRAPHGARLGHHVVTRHAGGARVGARQRREDAHGRRLARAVGPDEREDRAGGDAQVQAVERPHVAGIGFHEALGFDRRSAVYTCLHDQIS